MTITQLLKLSFAAQLVLIAAAGMFVGTGGMEIIIRNAPADVVTVK